MLQLVAGTAKAAMAGQSRSSLPKSPDVPGSGGRKSVLIIAGSDTFHDWRRTSPQLRALLGNTRRFDVRGVEDAGALESRSITDRYRTIILMVKPTRRPRRYVVILRATCGAAAVSLRFTDPSTISTIGAASPTCLVGPGKKVVPPKNTVPSRSCRPEMPTCYWAACRH